MSNHEMTAELPLSGTGRRRDRRQSYKVDPAFQSRFRIRILGLALAISALGAAVMGGAAAVTLMPGFTEHRTLLQITILAFVPSLLRRADPNPEDDRGGGTR
jgi:Mn2+/Fe2+ NRAMP family transporter